MPRSVLSMLNVELKTRGVLFFSGYRSLESSPFGELQGGPRALGEAEVASFET